MAKQRHSSNGVLACAARVTKPRALAMLLALLFTLVGTVASATDPRVEFSARFEPSTARVGEVVVLSVEATIPDGYHLYSLTQVDGGPKALTIKAKGLLPRGEWYAPQPSVEHDSSFDRAVEYYEGQVLHQRGFEVPRFAPGEHDIRLGITGQICNAGKCIAISEKRGGTALAPLSIERGEARPAFTARPKLSGESFPANRPAPRASGILTTGVDASAGHAGSVGDDSDMPREGLFGYLALAFLAGLGALVTPCVFPMIPITVAFFSKFTEVSTRRAVSMAGIYSLSIIGTFTVLGVVVSLAFGAVGMQAISSSVAFNLFLALLLTVFAFNLFGLFEIQVPSFLIARATAKEHQLLDGRGGSLGTQVLGVFFMGLTFTMISFTCTVGFIGMVLAEAAKGNWFYPALGMLTFSTAFALPFFFLAVFPSLAQRLRGRGGDWMTAVKVVLGFLELAGSFKFYSNVDLLTQSGLITRPLVLTIWTGIFLTAALYLLRLFELGSCAFERRAVGPLRMFVAILMLSTSAYAASGIRDAKSMGGWVDGWLPPAVYPGTHAVTGSDAVKQHDLEWIVDDIAGGLASAQSENKPLFVDFTGFTCTNCRFMEESVFSLPDVSRRLQSMVLVQAYQDGPKGEAIADYQVKHFDTTALPLYVILNPRTEEVLAKHTVDDTADADADFEAFLDRGLSAWKAAQAADSSANEVVAGVGEAPAQEHGAANIEMAGAPVDFSFPRIDTGEGFELSTLRGKWVFVNFWASWCAPCKKELREDFAVALAGAPYIELVSIAFDGEDSKTEALGFAREIDLLKHPTLLGGEDIEEAGLPAAFGEATSLPQSFLIHPDGHIAWAHADSIDEALLTQVFAQTKPQ